MESDESQGYEMPVERLLIERIVIAWMESHLVDKLCLDKRVPSRAYRQTRILSEMAGTVSGAVSTACKTLAQVRKLLGVNV